MVQQYSWVIFSWLLLALQVKVGKVASFVGKIFVVRPPTTKTTNFCPTKITRYTVCACHDQSGKTIASIQCKYVRKTCFFNTFFSELGYRMYSVSYYPFVKWPCLRLNTRCVHVALDSINFYRQIGNDR